MVRILASRLLPFIALSLCASLAVPAPGWAAFVPSFAPPAGGPADLSVLQASLESDLIASRLAQLGVEPGEAAARLASLTPSEREQVAAGLSSLQSGGEVQVFVAIDGVLPAPFLLGLLVLWLLVLAMTSGRAGY